MKFRNLRALIAQEHKVIFGTNHLVRNKQSLQPSGRSLSSSHENRGSPCQSINPSTEAISILSGEYKRFTLEKF